MDDIRKLRYVTKTISEEVSLEVQALLWRLMDILKAKRKEQMDYLQIFEIMINKKHIYILNKQEKPPILEKFVFGNSFINNSNKIVVWIIDDHEKQVMLFPSDY